MKNVKDLDDFNENFYEFILREIDNKSKRRFRKMSQREFCEKLGISESNFSHFKNGDVSYGIHTIIKICDYFGYDLSFKKRKKTPKE